MYLEGLCQSYFFNSRIKDFILRNLIKVNSEFTYSLLFFFAAGWVCFQGLGLMSVLGLLDEQSL